MFEELFNTTANLLKTATPTWSSSNETQLWIKYGWIGACVATVLVIITIIWATLIHYTYRKKWRTLDILLAAVLFQELPNAITLMVISFIKCSLINFPRWHLQANMTLCYILLWCGTSSRFFQFAIITSLIADRALILKWPYQYRFAVRHSQIRFYMIALALISSILGAIAVISHQNHYYNSNDFQATLDTWRLMEMSIDDSTTTATTINDNNSSRLNENANTNLTLEFNYLQFSYDPTIYDVHYSYFFLAIYSLLTVICICSFCYVESNRPRTLKLSTSAKSQQQHDEQHQRYLQSIATLFTTATTSSTATSSSTSSSLSASSPLQSRFSSLANLTNGSASASALGNGSMAPNNNNQSSKMPSLPSYYYPNVKHHEQQQQQHKLSGAINNYRTNSNGSKANNNDLYHITIADMLDSETVPLGPCSTFTSMTTTDNSIHRLIDTGTIVNNGTNDHNTPSTTPTATTPAQPNAITPSLEHGSPSILSPLDSSTTATLLRINSFNKSHHNLYSGSQLKLNISDSNDSSTLSTTNNHHSHNSRHHHSHHHHHHHHHHSHHSPFDLRWSSVVGPVSFCFAFNHGPYLIFTLLAIFVPKIWTPFHDLILAGLTLFEALLLPFIIFISNETFRAAVIRSSCIICHYQHQSHHHRHQQQQQQQQQQQHYRHTKHHRRRQPQSPYHSHGHNLNLVHQITASNNSNSSNNRKKCSLTFSTTASSTDGTGISPLQPPTTLNSTTSSFLSTTTNNNNNNNNTSNKYQQHRTSKLLTPIVNSLAAYHSDLDLLRKFSKIDQSSKLNKLSFLKHGKEFSNGRPLHATSMLDLSLCWKNGQMANQQQQYHQQPEQHFNQQSQHHQHYHQYQQNHASRSRYSLALAQQFPTNTTNQINGGSLTPKSSFCSGRPPSVASCHYLFSAAAAQAAAAAASMANQKPGSRYSQYLFGAMPNAKSESTLSVPIQVSAVSSSNPNYYESNQIKEIKFGNNNNNNNKECWQTNSGSCSPISINFNQFDTVLPINDKETILDGKTDALNHIHNAQKTATKTGPKLLELITGLASRSSFKKKSIRKCDSDASTFYNRHNIKRSQMANNQLSNILYNNFYSKKLIPTMFGSEIILLPDQQQQQTNDQHHRNYHCKEKLFRSKVSKNNGNNLYNAFEDQLDQMEHDSMVNDNCIIIDDEERKRTTKSPVSASNVKTSADTTPTGQFPRPHVYLPNVSPDTMDGHNVRSNSCQQLSLLTNRETDHYHNHLLLKQNLSILSDDSLTSSSTPLNDTSLANNKNCPLNNRKNDSNGGKKNNSIMAMDEEPIYASLPEETIEEEENDAVGAAGNVADDDDLNNKTSSGSFSARSTLPDNCQLIGFADNVNSNSAASHNTTTTAVNNENQLNFISSAANDRFGDSKSNSQINNDNAKNVNYARNDDGGPDGTTTKTINGHSNSSSTGSSIVESSEDIYEEVVHLIQKKSTEDGMMHFGQSSNLNKIRSASEDTLIQNDTFDNGKDSHSRTGSGMDHNHFNDDDEEGEEEEEDEDDNDDLILEEDQISILSETSSSTFSSFTTCANQDFEYIFSQQQQQQQQQHSKNGHNYGIEPLDENKLNGNNMDCVNNGTNNGSNEMNNIKTNLDNLMEKNSLEPCTLSMVAMYYNRLILNDNTNHAKSGHRQRASKLNRRQSFSTAHELRQRILHNQLTNKEQMGLIQEEDIEHELSNANGSILQQNNQQQQQQSSHCIAQQHTIFGDIFPMNKMDRRISSSEDNLLSIISTIVHCGDENNCVEIDEVNLHSPSNKKNAAIKCSNNNKNEQTTRTLSTNEKLMELATPKKLSTNNVNGQMKHFNETFIISKKSNDPLKNFNSTNSSNNSSPNKSSIPRLAPSQSTSATDGNKITIKELKSKKQAHKKLNNTNINNSNNGNDDGETAVKTKLKFTANNGSSNSNNNGRVYELGSLWERQTAKIVGEKSIPGSIHSVANEKFHVNNGYLLNNSPTNKNIKTANITPNTTTTNNNKSPAKSNPIPAVSLQSSTANQTKSTEASAARVPTFISVSPLRMPKHNQQTGKPIQNQFTSKLPPPSDYIVKQQQQQQQQQIKQNARQNAILAKNALLKSGIKRND